MRTRAASVLFAAFLGSLLVVAFAVPATAYIKQPLYRVYLSAPSVVKCDQSATVTARVVNLRTGKAVRGQTVNFRLVVKQSGGDRLSTYSARTNSSGYASTRVTFGPKAGLRRVNGRIPNSTPVINVRCAGGLPKTSVLPPEGYVEAPPAILIDEPVAPPPPVTSLAPLPATAVRLPRVGIDVPLVEGDGYQVPDAAVAHYPDTAWPGEGSNTYVYGHAREGQFLDLWRVRTGDLVEVQMADGTTADYAVSEIHPVVEWDALEYLQPTDHEILTLQTCLAYEETAPRFVVIAERIPAT
jgi:LPXTG-site transpeptidase (sortase) family protein